MLKLRLWLFTCLLIFCILLLTMGTASAIIIGYVAQEEDKYYEYCMDELLESYVIHLIGHPAKIYDDFASKKAIAFVDEIKEYVDYDDILEAYAISIITGKSFDVNTYIASDDAKPAVMPETIWLVGLGEDNQLTFTAKHLSPDDTLLRLINEADSVEDMKSALMNPGGDLGLDLTEYNKLNTYGKNLVVAGMLEQRPSEGYEDLEAVATAFYEETEKAKALLEATVDSVNSAPDKAALIAAILENAAILDIYTEGYEKLKDTEKDEVADIMFSKKPFSSPSDVKSAFEAAVTAAKSNINVNFFFTSYNLTLKQMVDIQMPKDEDDRSPQTDLYGGGWKNALREDVEYYVNPDNFADPHAGEEEREMAKITASVLNVRERPTTDSLVLTKVYSGEMYLIEDAKEGEPGTTSGTEGTWYQITATNVTGWIYGDYVEVTQASLNSSMFQFLVLSGSAGVSEEDLGKILNGRGILSGKESSFMEGSREHNVNEIFLVALSLHETGRGTSRLANGHMVVNVRLSPSTNSDVVDIIYSGEAFEPSDARDAEDETAEGTEGIWYKYTGDSITGWVCGLYVTIEENKAVVKYPDNSNPFLYEDYVVVYNMFGIGAYDSRPNYYGARNAYGAGWFTPELAILGGAQFASSSYINHSDRRQNTLYKMRWNPANPGRHQYATDIGWASKQVGRIRALYDQCTNYVLVFDIPKYKQ